MWIGSRVHAALASTAVAVLMLAGVVPESAAAAPERGSLVVATDRGLVRGARSSGVDNFLGIPYAAPPVGALRWEPPRPAHPWSGVRPATSYGNRCVALASTDGPQSLTEDCLYLNVQRPANSHRTAGRGQRLPVLFWMHGGGNFQGGSNAFDGSWIIQQTGIIVVTINFRLGAFGWMGLPALTAQQGESGNYGFLDQIAALRWVHRNIAAFGGDPANVTIAGQSTGGLSVCAMLASPAARGLFAAASMESGGCFSFTQSDAEAGGANVATSVGCTNPATVLVCLRAVDTKTLLDATGPYFSLPVSGTPTLPTDPGTALSQGAITRVPILFGTNLDEGRTFFVDATDRTRSDYQAFLTSSYGSQAPTVLAHYPWPRHANEFTARYLESAVSADSGGPGGCQTVSYAPQFAAVMPTWVYEFQHRDGPGLSPDPVGYVWGAGHAAELAYLWPSYNHGTPIAATFNAGERLLAVQMTQDWGNFVRHARPHATGQPDWDQFTTTRKVVMALQTGRRSGSAPITSATMSTEHQCNFWSSLNN